MTISLSIRIPERDQMRYLRGGCFVFAQELRRHVRRETGVSFALMALWVDGEPHHAFLVDPETGWTYDARGRTAMTLPAISTGSRVEGEGDLRPITHVQMRRWARHMDPHNARIDISRYVRVYGKEAV